MGMEETATNTSMRSNDANDNDIETQPKTPMVVEPPPSVFDRPEDEDTDGALRWDGSVDLSPLALGWDAEPIVLDWFGRGDPDLLVGSGGGSRGALRASIGRDEIQARTAHRSHMKKGLKSKDCKGFCRFAPSPTAKRLGSTSRRSARRV